MQLSQMSLRPRAATKSLFPRFDRDAPIPLGSPLISFHSSHTKERKNKKEWKKLSAKLIELKWSELKISQVFFFLLLSYMKWIMISFQFSFSLFREEFSKKVKIGQYWNVYLVYSIGWYDWDFKDENCLSSVKREWKRKFGFFKMGIWCGLLQVQTI